jgi:hypothetical protein
MIKIAKKTINNKRFNKAKAIIGLIMPFLFCKVFTSAKPIFYDKEVLDVALEAYI